MFTLMYVLVISLALSLLGLAMLNFVATKSLVSDFPNKRWQTSLFWVAGISWVLLIGLMIYAELTLGQATLSNYLIFIIMILVGVTVILRWRIENFQQTTWYHVLLLSLGLLLCVQVSYQLSGSLPEISERLPFSTMIIALGGIFCTLTGGYRLLTKIGERPLPSGEPRNIL